MTELKDVRNNITYTYTYEDSAVKTISGSNGFSMSYQQTDESSEAEKISRYSNTTTYKCAGTEKRLTYQYENTNTDQSDFTAVSNLGAGRSVHVTSAEEGDRLNVDIIQSEQTVWNWSIQIDGEDASVSYSDGTAQSYEYTDGNVATIINSSEQEADSSKIKSYTYDVFGQLKTSHNEMTGQDTVYAYDTNGNIKSRVITKNGTDTAHTYQYESSTWRDLLTKFDANVITYDAAGNPLSYRNGITFTWEQGRYLSSYQKASKQVTYSYNETGKRIFKRITDSETGKSKIHEYYWDDDQLIAESIKNDSTGTDATETQIWYYYDGDGNPIGFETSAGTYYYKKNMQQDIIGIVDNTGKLLVEYEYDDWGKVETIADTSSEGIGTSNAIRYRGYYMDTETGLYYVKSRYYDPVTCRFLNPDLQMDTVDNILGINLFTYCYNDPINKTDESGFQPKWAKAFCRAGKKTKTYKDFTKATQQGKYDDLFDKAGFVREDGTGIYHVKQDCWQEKWGYSDLYDGIFNLGTDMKREKYVFTVKTKTGKRTIKTKYVFWVWKGDYLNLGAGAELGIYYGGGPVWKVDTNLAVNMKLYLTYYGHKIIYYEPNEKVWWLTGFNSLKQSPKVNALTATFTIKLREKKDWYKACYAENKNKRTIRFDTRTKQVKIFL